jgi:hypothetical protein
MHRSWRLHGQLERELLTPFVNDFRCHDIVYQSDGSRFFTPQRVAQQQPARGRRSKQ